MSFEIKICLYIVNLILVLILADIYFMPQCQKTHIILFTQKTFLNEMFIRVEVICVQTYKMIILELLLGVFLC